MKIIWTAVPAAPTKEMPERNLSIAVSFKPTVSGDDPDEKKVDAELKAIQVVLANWPEFLGGLITDDAAAFKVRIGTAAPAPAKLLARAYDPEVWAGLIWNSPVSRMIPAHAHFVLPRRTAAAAAMYTSTNAAVMDRLINQILARSALAGKSLEPEADYDARDASGRPTALQLRATSQTEDELAFLRWEKRAGEIKLPAARAVKSHAPTVVKAPLTPSQHALVRRNLLRLAIDPDGDLVPSIVEKVADLVRARSNTPDEQQMWLEHLIFYYRIPQLNAGIRAARNLEPSDLPGPAPDFDVFARLVACHNFPRLLRPLGLAFDLSINADAIPPGDQRLTILPQFAVPVTSVTPATVVRKGDRGQIVAVSAEQRPKESWIRDGCLHLEGGEFNVVTSDVEATPIKIFQAVGTHSSTEGIVVVTRAAEPFTIIDRNEFAHELGKAATLRELLLTALPGSVVEKEKAYGAFAAAMKLYGLETATKFDGTRAWCTGTYTFPNPLTFSYIAADGSPATAPTRTLLCRAVRRDGGVAALRWQLLDDPAFREPAPLKVPAARTTGVSLIWKDRAERVRAAVERAKQMDQDSTVYAESLVVGYVPDLWMPDFRTPGEGTWLPLTRRYEAIVDAISYSGEAEGVVRHAVGRMLDHRNNADAIDPADPHISEVVFAHKGWTLGLERPLAPDIVPGDFASIDQVCSKLRAESKRTLQPIWNLLPSSLQRAITTATSSDAAKALAKPLAAALTAIVHRQNFDRGAFDDVPKSPIYQAHLHIFSIERLASSFTSAWCNRVLLEDLFEGGLTRRRRPALAESMDDSAGLEALPETDHGWALRTVMEAYPGSIPELRLQDLTKIRDEYAVRVRLSDLAGNITQLANDDRNAGPSLEFSYRRYEPAAPPPLMLDVHPREMGDFGRGLNRMVVRDVQETDSRWTVPARVSDELAEMHGVLDDDSLDDIGSFDATALTPTGEFPMAAPTDDPDSDPRAPRLTTGTNCFPLRLPPNSDDRPPVIPYFPDPWALCLAWQLEYLVIGPRGPTMWRQTEPGLVPFYRDVWPLAKAIKITLSRGTRPLPYSRLSSDEEALHIYVPPGMSVRLHLTACIGTGVTWERAVDAFAINYETMKLRLNLSDRTEKLSDSQVKALIAETKDSSYAVAMRHGQLEAFAGRNTIELTHATMKPVAKPVLKVITRDGSAEYRPAGVLNSGKVTLDFDVRVDAPSTGKVRITAEWEVPRGDPTSPLGYARESGFEAVGDQQIEADCAGSGLTAPPVARYQHNVPDCRYRAVRYTAIATSRFVGQFPSRQNPADFDESSEPKYVPLLNCARPAVLKFAYFLPVFDWQRSEGNSRFERTRRGLVRLFFEDPMYSSGDGEMIGIVAYSNADVKRTLTSGWGADPIREYVEVTGGPTPELFEGHAVFSAGEIYDLPGWARVLKDEDDSSQEREILVSNMSADTREQLAKYRGGFDHVLVRHLTRDIEILLNSGKLTWPRLQALTKQAQGTDLGGRLLDLNGRPRVIPVGVTGSGPIDSAIIPYTPHFDAETKLWFCDVSLKDMPAEYMFIRLAVVRYQPFSVPGAETSDVTLVDFIQLAPERTAVVWLDPADADQLTLQVQVLAGKNVKVSGPVAFDLEVLEQDEKRSWEVDVKIEKEVRIMPAPGVLCSAKFRWPKHMGERRLLITERFPASSGNGQTIYPYIEVLGL